MATVTVTLTNICSGGNHLTFELTGATTASVPMMLSDISEPFTDEEKSAFVKAIARLAKIGKTNAQARTVLQGGVTVTA